MKFYATLFVLLASFFSRAQTFTLQDSLFETGSIFRTYSIDYEFDKKTPFSKSIPVLDSIADFLLKQKRLVIEIGCHTDSRLSDLYASALTKRQAEFVMGYLIRKGVDRKRLKALGFAAIKPLIPDSEIKKLKTKEEREAAHQKNIRTEFKIIEIH